MLIITSTVLSLLIVGGATYYSNRLTKKLLAIKSEQQQKQIQLDQAYESFHQAIHNRSQQLTEWEASLVQMKISLEHSSDMNANNNRKNLELFINQNKQFIKFSEQVKRMMDEDVIVLDKAVHLMFDQIIKASNDNIDELERVYFHNYGRNYQTELAFRSFKKDRGVFGVN